MRNARMRNTAMQNTRMRNTDMQNMHMRRDTMQATAMRRKTQLSRLMISHRRTLWRRMHIPLWQDLKNTVKS